MKHLRRLYRALTAWIHTSWVGGVQAAFVVRSLHLQNAIKRLDSLDGKRCLDVGCGEQAALSAVLARRYKGAHFTATDLCLISPLPNMPNLDLVIQDIQEPCLRGFFDVVYSLDVLEHLEDPRKVLSSFSRWLVSGGMLYLHTPTKARVSFFSGSEGADRPLCRPVRPGDLHIWEGFSVDELRRWLEECGFRVLKATRTFHPALWFLKEVYTLGERRHLPGIGLLLLPFIALLARWEMFFPPTEGNGIWIEARKNPDDGTEGRQAVVLCSAPDRACLISNPTSSLAD